MPRSLLEPRSLPVSFSWVPGDEEALSSGVPTALKSFASASSAGISM